MLLLSFQIYSEAITFRLPVLKSVLEFSILLHFGKWADSIYSYFVCAVCLCSRVIYQSVYVSPRIHLYLWCLWPSCLLVAPAAFIIYSSCHLQLFWHWDLSNGTQAHDVQHTAAWLCAPGVHNTLKLVVFNTKEFAIHTVTPVNY